MKDWALAGGLLTVALMLSIVATIKPRNPTRPFEGVSEKEIMDPHEERPALWLFYNSGDVNSRWWSDFGARSSRVINKPYLNICYETIVAAAGDRYRIEIIQGLPDAIERLGGADMVPAPLRNKKSMLKEEEVQFLATAFLAQFGGLWISPSTICIKEIPVLPADKIIGFGTSDTETYSAQDGTPVPNTQYMWCPNKGTPMFSKWAKMLYERLDGYEGGFRTRRDNQFDWTYVTTGACGIEKQSSVTLQRKSNGRRIELDDLLAAGTEGDLPFDVPDEVIFVPIPYFELDRRSNLQWFLRLSEQQIMESDLAITYLFRDGLSLNQN